MKNLQISLQTNFFIALDALKENRFRAFMSALGVFLGTASLVAMLAINKGTEQAFINQMELIGTNNILVVPNIAADNQQKNQQENSSTTNLNQTNNSVNANANTSAQTHTRNISSGLSLKDAEIIRKILPNEHYISPEVLQESTVFYQQKQLKTTLIGVEDDFFKISNFNIIKGRKFKVAFSSPIDDVCIIGQHLEAKLFGAENSLGKYVKCGNKLLCVVGVLEQRMVEKNPIAELGIRNYNLDIYVPIRSFLLSYQNRGKTTPLNVEATNHSENHSNQFQNYHQIDRLIIQVNDNQQIIKTAEIIGRILRRSHQQQTDFKVIIPEELIRQQQRTQALLRVVLGIIAGIALIVGGIGIANIMLASVVERTREIGIRMTCGAKKADILMQFLIEAVCICLIGGLAGVFLGLLSSKLIAYFADILTIITPMAVVFPFVVCLLVGLLAGFYPAKKATQYNPADNLRYE